MLKKITICLIYLICLTALPSSSGAIEQQAKRYVLDNGLVVILKEVKTAPVVSLQAWIKAGSITEDDYLGSGISHLIEHMLFKGTKKRGVGQIALEVRAAGGEIGGYTSFDHTCYHLTLPSSQLELGLDVLSDAIINPSFDEEELKKEKQVILKELNMNEDDPERYINRLLWKTAYSVHPYRYPIIGYQPLFEKLSRDDLLKYYQKQYLPNNLILSISGDFDTSSVLSKVKEAFNFFPRQSLAPLYIPEEPPQLGLKIRVEEYDLKLAHLRMGFHIPSIRSPDVFPLDLLAIILGQGRDSRLYKEIKESQQLVYSISAWSYTPAQPGLFGIEATLEPKNLKKAEKAILKEIDRIKKGLVTSKELAAARQKVISQHIFSLQTVESQASDLASNELACDNINFSQLYLQRIKQVTPEEIRMVANRYLFPDNLTIVALVPKREAATASVSLPLPRPRITKKVLDNGLTLLIREDHNLPIITLKAVFKGGLLCEPEGKNGLCYLTQHMLLKGTRKRSRQEIASEIESRGGSISSYGGNNSLGCSINILKDDLSTGLEILSDVIMNPIFAEEELKKEKDLTLAAIKSQEDDLFTSGLKLLKATLWQKHPYRFQTIGSQDVISSLKRDDLLAFHQAYCRPNNMVLAVFGDVQTEVVEEMVKQIFARFEPKQLPVIDCHLEPEQTEVRAVTVEREKTQALIMLGFHSLDLFNPDRYVVEVMDAVLSGQNSRLFNAIREEQGLVYYVDAFSILGLEPGAYIFYLGTTLDKVELSLNKLLAEIERIKAEEISSEELNRAKLNLIGQKMIGLQTNDAYALESALDELYGLGYDNLDSYQDKISRITAEDIKRVANKYFNLSSGSMVVIKPRVRP